MANAVYEAMRRGRLQRRRKGRPPQREWVIAGLRDCVCWGDLFRLAKWYLASCVLIHRRRYCWSSLASWSWLTWRQHREEGTELRPVRDGARCERESHECGSCWCGKFVDEAVMRAKYGQK